MENLLKTSSSQAYAEKEITTIKEEDFGTNLHWKLESDGNLIISGTGVMPDWVNYGNKNRSPWYFQKDNIKSVEIKDGVTNIGKNAFFDLNNLTNINIPASVKNIDVKPFENCFNLTNIDVVADNSKYANYNNDGVLYEKDSDGNLITIIQCPYKKSGNIIIPESVTKIGYAAFNCCSGLQEIIMPNVNLIDRYAFNGCNSLKKITMPKVTNIGKVAFNSCSGLKEITIPDSLTEIKIGAFNGCSGLTKITVGEAFINNINKEKINNDSFEGLSDRQITINVTGNISLSNSNIIEKILSIKPVDWDKITMKEVVTKWVNEIQINGKRVYPNFIKANDNVGIDYNKSETQYGYPKEMTKFKFTVKPGYQLKSVKVNGIEANILNIKDASFSDGVDYILRFIMPNHDVEISFETGKITQFKN